MSIMGEREIFLGKKVFLTFSPQKKKKKKRKKSLLTFFYKGLLRVTSIESLTSNKRPWTVILVQTKGN